MASAYMFPCHFSFALYAHLTFLLEQLLYSGKHMFLDNNHSVTEHHRTSSGELNELSGSKSRKFILKLLFSLE